MPSAQSDSGAHIVTIAFNVVARLMFQVLAALPASPSVCVSPFGTLENGVRL